MELRNGKVPYKFLQLFFLRIIEPIASRCAKFRFKELSAKAIYEQLKYISKMEAVEIEEEV